MSVDLFHITFKKGKSDVSGLFIKTKAGYMKVNVITDAVYGSFPEGVEIKEASINPSGEIVGEDGKKITSNAVRAF